MSQRHKNSKKETLPRALKKAAEIMRVTLPSALRPHQGWAVLRGVLEKKHAKLKKAPPKQTGGGGGGATTDTTRLGSQRWKQERVRLEIKPEPSKVLAHGKGLHEKEVFFLSVVLFYLSYESLTMLHRPGWTIIHLTFPP